MRVLFVFLLHIVISSSVQADKREQLFEPIETQLLTYDDKRFLQTALAFEGYYNALIDGDWGKGSQRALVNYSWMELKSAPAAWHMAMLTLGLADLNAVDGWNTISPEGLGVSFLYPLKTGQLGAPSDYLVNLEHSRSSLSYSYTSSQAARARRLHDYALSVRASWKEPYLVNKRSLVITSVEQPNGTWLYVRSDLVRGRWSTVLLSARPKDKNILQAVASSIAKGASRAIQVTNGGYLEQNVMLALELAEQEENKRREELAGSPRNVVTSQPENTRSSGTAFWVSNNGVALTNHHVVNGCSEVSLDGQLGEVLSSSQQYDLALVQISSPKDTPKVSFAQKPAYLNADVTVVGYPLSGLLGGLNVTRGAVSSATGLGGDGTMMQITAPVQPGNSGGPVFDEHGQVIGVVVGKLDTLNIAETIGDIPQNVNFAIRSEIAKLFMYQSGVTPGVSDLQETLKPEMLAESAKSATVLLECK